MAGPATARLDALRHEIARLEKRPALSGSGPITAGERTTGRGGLGDVLAPLPGLLQEVFADDPRGSGTALGFALGLVRGLVTEQRAALIYLQLGADAHEFGLPYGMGLAHFGVAASSLVIGRMETVPELLWALEEALACRAVAGVIAEFQHSHRALDFTASRRLSLRAAATGASAVLVRYGRDREASAARLRWRAQPAPSAVDVYDPRAPGHPRFALTLERARLGLAAHRAEGLSFLVDWTDHGFLAVEPRPDPQLRRTAPLSGAVPAAMGDRLSEAG